MNACDAINLKIQQRIHGEEKGQEKFKRQCQIEKAVESSRTILRNPRRFDQDKQFRQITQLKNHSDPLRTNIFRKPCGSVQDAATESWTKGAASIQAYFVATGLLGNLPEPVFVAVLEAGIGSALAGVAGLAGAGIGYGIDKGVEHSIGIGLSDYIAGARSIPVPEKLMGPGWRFTPDKPLF